MKDYILNKIEYNFEIKEANFKLDSYSDEEVCITFEFLGVDIYIVKFRKRIFSDKKKPLWITSYIQDLATKYIGKKNLDEILLNSAKKIMKERNYYIG